MKCFCEEIREEENKAIAEKGGKYLSNYYCMDCEKKIKEARESSSQKMKRLSIQNSLEDNNFEDWKELTDEEFKPKVKTKAEIKDYKSRLNELFKDRGVPSCFHNIYLNEIKLSTNKEDDFLKNKARILGLLN